MKIISLGLSALLYFCFATFSVSEDERTSMDGSNGRIPMEILPDYQGDTGTCFFIDNETGIHKVAVKCTEYTKDGKVLKFEQPVVLYVLYVALYDPTSKLQNFFFVEEDESRLKSLEYAIRFQTTVTALGAVVEGFRGKIKVYHKDLPPQKKSKSPPPPEKKEKKYHRIRWAIV